MMAYKKTFIISIVLTFCVSITAQEQISTQKSTSNPKLEYKFSKIENDVDATVAKAPYIFRFSTNTLSSAKPEERKKALEILNASEDLKNGTLQGWFAKNGNWKAIYAPLGLSLFPSGAFYLGVAGLSSTSLLRKGCAVGAAILPIALVYLYQMASYQPEWFSYFVPWEIPEWVKKRLPNLGQKIELKTAIANAKDLKNIVAQDTSTKIFYAITDNQETIREYYSAQQLNAKNQKKIKEEIAEHLSSLLTKWKEVTTLLKTYFPKLLAFADQETTEKTTIETTVQLITAQINALLLVYKGKVKTSIEATIKTLNKNITNFNDNLKKSIANAEQSTQNQRTWKANIEQLNQALDKANKIIDQINDSQKLIKIERFEQALLPSTITHTPNTQKPTESKYNAATKQTTPIVTQPTPPPPAPSPLPTPTPQPPITPIPSLQQQPAPIAPPSISPLLNIFNDLKKSWPEKSNIANQTLQGFSSALYNIVNNIVLKDKMDKSTEESSNQNITILAKQYANLVSERLSYSEKDRIAENFLATALENLQKGIDQLSLSINLAILKNLVGLGSP